MTVVKTSELEIESNGYTFTTISTDLILCVLGEEEIKHLVPNDWSHTVLISIQDPGSTLIPKEVRDLYSDVLCVQFWDVTQEQTDRMKEWSETTGNRVFEPITFEQGTGIRKWILKHRDKQFAIHCAAGISRSSGTAQAIECLLDCNGDIYWFQTAYDDEVRKHWRYYPNHTVFERIVGTSGDYHIR